MQFNQPVYCSNYTRIYPFEEYGDVTNYFIKLVYYIERNAFVSRKGLPLSNHTSMNDEPIFHTSDKIDISKYTLLKETISEVDIPNVVQIDEVYGYAPTDTYNKQAYDVYTFKATEDISAISQTEAPLQSAANNTYDNMYDRLTIIVSDTSIFELGQNVRLYAVPLTTSNGYYGESVETRILAKTATTVTIENTTLQFYDWSGAAQGAHQKTQLVYFTNYHRSYSGATFWYGNIYVQRVGLKTAERSFTVSISETISFYDSKPAIETDEERFKVLDANGAEADTLDFSTTPSLTTYQGYVAAKTEIVIEDPKIENLEVEGKTYDMIYKKTVRRTVAQ